MTAHDNPGSCDQITLQRPALAASCVAPAARAAGKLPVYADLWLQKAAPVEAINHALEEALEEALAGALVPAGKPIRLMLDEV